jgi:deoxyribodipyrimidine photo-lyase
MGSSISDVRLGQSRAIEPDCGVARPSVMWFRRDLRLADNPALSVAAEHGPVVPLFVIDPVLFERSGTPRAAFLVAALRELGASMDRKLVVRFGDPIAVVPAVAAEVAADTVFAAGDHGPYGTRRDRAVSAALAADGRRLELIASPYAVEPGSVRKQDGSTYRVFTPFARAWAARGWDAPMAAPRVDWLGDPEVACAGYPRIPPTAVQIPPAGERAAHERLDAFLAGPLARYDTGRDRPDLEGTSRLSVDLRWGVLHPRQILVHLGDEPAHRSFRGELAWREFYADVLHHRPDAAWHELQPAMAAMAVDRDGPAHARFACWSAGTTGYPIVDAGMRQLDATGWMHNRVRMIAASFLVKDLHLPWQWGARHFMDHLVDGDLASNSQGWQWVAGTGTDAAPYFRIFNPVVQGRRFDPDGSYVRRWVPELADVAGPGVHEPWTAATTRLDYPDRIVDHAAERDEALARYDAVRSPHRRTGPGSR